MRTLTSYGRKCSNVTFAYTEVNKYSRTMTADDSSICNLQMRIFVAIPEISGWPQIMWIRRVQNDLDSHKVTGTEAVNPAKNWPLCTLLALVALHIQKGACRRWWWILIRPVPQKCLKGEPLETDGTDFLRIDAFPVEQRINQSIKGHERVDMYR